MHEGPATFDIFSSVRNPPLFAIRICNTILALHQISLKITNTRGMFHRTCQNNLKIICSIKKCHTGTTAFLRHVQV